jgi:hypothetical protein
VVRTMKRMSSLAKRMLPSPELAAQGTPKAMETAQTEETSARGAASGGWMHSDSRMYAARQE